ncbi:MAG: 6-phosphogluconolactonase [Actinomycetota bacterium]
MTRSRGQGSEPEQTATHSGETGRAPFNVDGVRVTVDADRQSMGRAAATIAAGAIREAIRVRGKARVVFAAAPSQSETLAALASRDDIEWRRVEAFHMDEYVGLDPTAPQAFGQWLRDHLFDQVDLGRVALIDPTASPEAEAARYGDLVTAESIDLVCLGIGENGHIAFNEPHQAHIADQRSARVVDLDLDSLNQQVSDGLFNTADDVPATAITLTVPTLLSARTLVGSIPGSSKATAVATALSGPISTACPASFLRRHDSVHLHLDTEAAAYLDIGP